MELPPVPTTARKAQFAGLAGFFMPILSVAVPCSDTAVACVGSMQAGTLLLQQVLAFAGLVDQPDPTMVGGAVNALLGGLATGASAFLVAYLATNKPK